ncbi:PREDICTED: uncharacterized protein LOC105449802 [Wasmannia auropunctata]|uniref:uncharacterized protein LOC105449802 n=1 Tax=Wasmannia auropunctata TaxID=64793 RepID=UPI0005EDC497|nr:PREDICTED: uncharacterized protein LOC105449802 [Wasmannia auropunctata]
MAHLMVCDTSAEMWKRLETVMVISQKRSNDTESQQKPKSKFCVYCKKHGHIKQDCRFKKAREKKAKEEKAKDEKSTRLSLIATRGQDFKMDTDWILDSGASDHMTFHAEWYNRDEFTVYKIPRKIKVGNKHLIDAIGEGNINVEVFDGSKWISATLKKVLYVPELAHNVFSEGTVLDKGLTYEADQTECKFSQGNIVVATGTRIGKQHRLSFPSSSSRKVTPGKLLHVDLNSPMEIDSIGGSNYFINFRDDASSYRTVYFMKHKSETKNIIQKHIKLVENDTGNRIGILRSDNGTEFIDKVVKNIIEEHGMRHQLSIALIRQSRMDAQNVTIGLLWKVPEA